MKRQIRRVIRAEKHPLGPDLTVARPLPSYDLDYADPFLFLDHLGPMPLSPSHKLKGTGAHPHRGFSTLFYAIEGTTQHKDSLGNVGLVHSGGLQYMLAGSGIIHDEGPDESAFVEGGRLQGIQLWINLPKAWKGAPPAYYQVQPEEVPRLTAAEGVEARLLLGEYRGLKNPFPVYSPMWIVEWCLAPGASYTVNDIPGDWNLFAYLTEWPMEVEGQTVAPQHLVWTAKGGEELSLHNPGSEEARIILYAGQPLNEPVYSHGPFVMNTAQEIRMAYNDFFNGKYGKMADAE